MIASSAWYQFCPTIVHKDNVQEMLRLFRTPDNSPVIQHEFTPTLVRLDFYNGDITEDTEVMSDADAEYYGDLASSVTPEAIQAARDLHFEKTGERIDDAHAIELAVRDSPDEYD